VVVTTAKTSHSAINREQAISLMLNDGSRVLAHHKFFYRLDPRVTGIEPKNHLIMYAYVEYQFTSLGIYLEFPILTGKLQHVKTACAI